MSDSSRTRNDSPGRAALLILTLGFWGVIWLVALVDGVGLLRTPTDPREEFLLERLDAIEGPTADRLITGAWAGELAPALTDASLVGSHLRAWNRFITLGWLRQAPDDVVLGEENWLFYGPSFLPPKETVLPQVVAAVALARQKGVRVSVVFVPSKAQIYPEYLPAPAATHPKARYDELLALCAENGIITVDLRSGLWAAKDIADEHLYHPVDTHCTTSGYLVIANAIAGDVLQVPDEQLRVRVAEIIEQRGPADSNFNGDLHRMLDLPPGSSLNKPYRVPLRWPPPVNSVQLTDEGSLLWVGDSFSRYHEQFLPKATAHLAGRSDLQFLHFLKGWSKKLAARLDSPSKPKHLIICLAARWF